MNLNAALILVSMLGQQAPLGDAGSATRAQQSVVFSVVAPDRLFLFPGSSEFSLTLDLYNQGDEPILVDPSLGGMCGRVTVHARPIGTNASAHPIYDHAVNGCAFAVDDLFKLMPHRHLRREIRFCYAEAAGVHEMEFWAEYDCQDMKTFDRRAFGGLLKSGVLRVPIVRYPAEE
jgi:hypothetical protein